MTDKKLFQQLVEFQAELPAITKEANNPFFKSKYATLEAIQQTIQPLLTKHGLGYMFMPTVDGLACVLFNTTGEKIEFVYPANLTGKPQDIGSNITYAKRYALCAMLGLIVGDEDDDGNKAQETAKPVQKDEKLESIDHEQALQITLLLSDKATQSKGYAYYKKIGSKTKIDVADYEMIQEAIKTAYGK
jgi:hypothetical protein